MITLIKIVRIAVFAITSPEITENVVVVVAPQKLNLSWNKPLDIYDTLQILTTCLYAANKCK